MQIDILGKPYAYWQGHRFRITYKFIAKTYIDLTHWTFEKKNMIQKRSELCYLLINQHQVKHITLTTLIRRNNVQ